MDIYYIYMYNIVYIVYIINAFINMHMLVCVRAFIHARMHTQICMREEAKWTWKVRDIMYMNQRVLHAELRFAVIAVVAMDTMIAVVVMETWLLWLHVRLMELFSILHACSMSQITPNNNLTVACHTLFFHDDVFLLCPSAK